MAEEVRTHNRLAIRIPVMGMELHVRAALGRPEKAHLLCSRRAKHERMHMGIVLINQNLRMRTCFCPKTPHGRTHPLVRSNWSHRSRAVLSLPHVECLGRPLIQIAVTLNVCFITMYLNKLLPDNLELSWQAMPDISTVRNHL